MPRLVCISDTHQKPLKGVVPPGDILIHAGDLTMRGTKEVEVRKALADIEKLGFKHVVCIAGNHEFFCEKTPFEAVEKLFAVYGAIYLQDSGIELEGLKIYGSPWTPRFYDWAFNADEEIERYWQKVPEDTDVLVTHGPPYGILDQNSYGMPSGCKFLLDRVHIIKPRLHVFGHLHEAYGISRTPDTTFVNAALVDVAYRPINAPIIIDL